VSRWPSKRDPKTDPWWDLDGPAAREARRRSRVRRVAAAIAWLDVLAISALTLVGPHAFRLAFLR
jgi:hypothetical protein